VTDPQIPPPPADLPDFHIPAIPHDEIVRPERLRLGVEVKLPDIVDALSPPVVVLPHVLVPAGTGIPGRVRLVWEVVQALAEQLVEAAEAWVLLDTGEQRKQWATAKLRRLVRELEARFDVLPAPVERAVLWALDRAAGWLVEQAFRRLDAAGKINVHRA
jgi:hypothetical protein